MEGPPVSLTGRVDETDYCSDISLIPPPSFHPLPPQHLFGSSLAVVFALVVSMTASVSVSIHFLSSTCGVHGRLSLCKIPPKWFPVFVSLAVVVLRLAT